ncbi:MAG: phospholipase D family protein [Actinomycetota bacterium]|nr:phospholipase D family protein [Actinomycetota bacterium]
MSDIEEVLAAFETASLDGLPTLDAVVGDERLLMLWVLHVGKERADITSMTPGEIEAVLRDVFGHRVSRQRVLATLAREKESVARRRRRGKNAFQLMQAGSQEVLGSTPRAIFVDPQNAIERVREVETIFAGLQGTVRICDPYVDPVTLTYVAECTSAHEVRLLTVNVNKDRAFRRDLKIVGRQLGVSVLVKQAPRGLLHDRYVIHDDGMLLFGTSLNGLGLKQSFVVALGEDIHATLTKEFDRIWNSQATGYP